MACIIYSLPYPSPTLTCLFREWQATYFKVTMSLFYFYHFDVSIKLAFCNTIYCVLIKRGLGGMEANQ